MQNDDQHNPEHLHPSQRPEGIRHFLAQLMAAIIGPSQNHQKHNDTTKNCNDSVSSHADTDTVENAIQRTFSHPIEFKDGTETYRIKMEILSGSIGTFNGLPIYETIRIENATYVYAGVGSVRDIENDIWGRDAMGRWVWPGRILINGLLYIKTSMNQKQPLPDGSMP